MGMWGLKHNVQLKPQKKDKGYERMLKWVMKEDEFTTQIKA